jgi:hypothetical protein
MASHLGQVSASPYHSRERLFAQTTNCRFRGTDWQVSRRGETGSPARARPVLPSNILADRVKWEEVLLRSVGCHERHYRFHSRRARQTATHAAYHLGSAQDPKAMGLPLNNWSMATTWTGSRATTDTACTCTCIILSQSVGQTGCSTTKQIDCRTSILISSRVRGSARSAAAGRAHTLAEHLRTQADLCASRGLAQALLMCQSIRGEEGGASWRSRLVLSVLRHTGARTRERQSRGADIDQKF